MPTLAMMSTEQRERYLKLLGQSTEAVLPKGAAFAVLIFDGEEELSFVSDIPTRDRQQLVRALRDLADTLEE